MTYVEIPNNTSLLRLVVNNLSRFRRQDWYYNHEFANKSVGGGWSVVDWLPASVWAYLYVIDSPVLHTEFDLFSNYIWTSDYDDDDQQVYVGMSRDGGFQIHRHLRIDDKMFINRR